MRFSSIAWIERSKIRELTLSVPIVPGFRHAQAGLRGLPPGGNPE
jgi:hypothetical protein